MEIAPLTLKDIAQVEEQALADYKRSYLQTYTQNADLLLPEDRQPILREAFAQAARMGLDALPVKTQEVMVNGRQVQREVPYAIWWGSSTIAGQLHTTWLSMRRANPGITFDEVNEALTPDMSQLESIVDAVGEMSSPGNPPTPELVRN